MSTIKNRTIWFVTGTQHLYGEKTLKQVAANAETMVKGLNKSAGLPVKLVFKPILKTAEEVQSLLVEANRDPACAGLITWMHTFSPAKMWIAGLSTLNKPFCHLHTQFGREIPWSTIDMNYMNLNQSAHGCREFGFICSRLRLNRKVVVGYWEDPEVHSKLEIWSRAALAVADMRNGKIARFGDNMREVAVTEGDKVEAQLRLGITVHGYGLGDLVASMKEVGAADVKALLEEYAESYEMSDAFADKRNKERLAEQARIELGLEAFLTRGGFTGFTTTFEDLYGLSQLPGLAVQRLMAKGYGFGAEGDWKTSSLVRALKVMAQGKEGGCSFMEDYTYHMDRENPLVLGAHMLEVCPSIASSARRPSLQIHPLSIGGKDDPARLVFDAAPGAALNASLMDMGDRFRLLVNELEVVKSPELPKLPVARALWKAQPDLATSAEAWILAGGAHHSAFSQAVTVEHLESWADIYDIEMVVIDKNTDIREFKKELRWNDLYYQMRR